MSINPFFFNITLIGVLVYVSAYTTQTNTHTTHNTQYTHTHVQGVDTGALMEQLQENQHRQQHIQGQMISPKKVRHAIQQRQE